jgi:hypothetical protein
LTQAFSRQTLSDKITDENIMASIKSSGKN